MYKRGKQGSNIGPAIEGFEKLMKSDVKEPIVISNIVKGVSDEYGPFVYVIGTHQGNPVYVSVPSASLDDFNDITSDDIAEITEQGLRLFIEKHTSKKQGRLYYTAYID